MMPTPRRQAGVSLIVALLMLTILSLLGVNAVNNSTTDLRIVSNMQGQQDAVAAIQDAIEQVISSTSNFETPVAQTIRIERPDYDDYLDVQVAAPVCRSSTPAQDGSVLILSTEETIWEVTATAEDPASGARAEVHQGVSILMLPGLCPVPTAL